MKQKPPRYTLDRETRSLLGLSLFWARQLSTVQQKPTDIEGVVLELCERFGIELDEPTDTKELSGPGEVVPLRPFRVITTKQSEPEDETQ